MDLNTNNPDDIKQLISLLQKLLPVEDSQEQTKSKRSKSRKRKVDEFNNPNIQTKSPKRIEQTKNKFLDMPERNLHKEDTEVDKKLSKHPPTPRNRHFTPVDVRCRVCGKHESVNPAIIPESKDRYKCNKCSSSAGG